MTQHFNKMSLNIKLISSVPRMILTHTSVLPCKTKRQYLLVLQVSRYCLLPLQRSVNPVAGLVDAIFPQAGDVHAMASWWATFCNVADLAQQKQNICITFVQRRHNVFDVGPTLHKCYTNVLCCWARLHDAFVLGMKPARYSFMISHILLLWPREVP